MKSCAKVFESIPRSKLIFPELRRPFVKGSNYQLEPLDLYWKFGSLVIPKINSLEVIKPTTGTADHESLGGFFCYKRGTTCVRESRNFGVLLKSVVEIYVPVQQWVRKTRGEIRQGSGCLDLVVQVGPVTTADHLRQAFAFLRKPLVWLRHSRDLAEVRLDDYVSRRVRCD